MNRHSLLNPVTWISLLAAASCVPAQSRIQNSKEPVDATWARSYAATHRSINGDPQFLPLLRQTLARQQWFWRDHGRFTPVPELAQLFIGIQGRVFLDEGRYLTAEGCVPHDCSDNGMVWIDTGAHPARVVFIAMDYVQSPSGQPAMRHLWIFGNSRMNWQEPPGAFLSSFSRWIKVINEGAYKGEYKFASATFVMPTGEMTQIEPSLLHLDTANSGAPQ